MVGDGVLWYAYSPVTLFTSPVSYDGTIDASSGTAHMTGRVRGNHLEAIGEVADLRDALLDGLHPEPLVDAQPGQPDESPSAWRYSSTAKRSVIPAM